MRGAGAISAPAGVPVMTSATGVGDAVAVGEAARWSVVAVAVPVRTAGVKVAVTPLGSPLALIVMAPLEPLKRLTVTGRSMVPPWSSRTSALALEMLTSGAAVPPPVYVTSSTPIVAPRPSGSKVRTSK